METKPHPKPALPLLALLLLASALGIAAAVVLAGVAMLLAAPAYADEGSLNSNREHMRVVEACRNPVDEPLAGFYVVHAVLRLRHTAAPVERTEEIAPGELLLVELTYRRRGARRLLT